MNFSFRRNVSLSDAIVCSLSLLLCRNLPNAWNRERVSSFPNGKQNTSSKLTLSSLSFEGRIGLLCGFRQRYCRELIACLTSPPLALAISSIESEPTSRCSFLHIVVSVFLIELTVAGLKLTSTSTMKRYKEFFPAACG